MPDGKFDESHGQIVPEQTAKPRNALVHWLSAFVSLGVLAAMVFWGLQLVQRDPNEVPVIKAMSGPARDLPKDPGGAQSVHAGLAVNSVQSDGSAQAPAERVVLAPPPRELLAQDIAVPKQVVPLKQVEAVPEEPRIKDIVEAEVKPAIARPPALAKILPTELEDREAKEGPVTITVRDVPEGSMIDTSAGIARVVTDADLTAEAADRKAAEDAALQAAKARAAILLEDEQINRGTKFAPLVAAAPPPRPTQTVTAKSAQIKAEIKAAAANEVAARAQPQEVSDVALGSWLVQIGAYDSRDVALSEWSRISRRNSDLFASKKFVIQPAQSGGHKFYRLRAVGFENAKSSKSFCTALKQRKLDCIAVAVR